MTHAMVHGVNFTNKGAELMLCAIQQKLAEWDRKNTLSADTRTGTFQQRQAAGMKHLALREPCKIPYSAQVFLAETIPSVLRNKLNLRLESEVDLVLDASGFAYSDECGLRRTEEMARLCRRWQQQGKKVVLLPQAFGPFSKALTGQYFPEIISHADLVFARDKQSYLNITELGVPIDNVHIAPDFTNLVKGHVPDYARALRQRACIIPNFRMIEKTSAEIRVSYIPFIATLINTLEQHGLQPFILLHETNDVGLGQALMEQLPHRVPLVNETDPLAIKGIIGQSSLVVSSRFHGLVSALSQGVPSLGTGWSHKYQKLFQDYGCPDCLIDIGAGFEAARGQLKRITDENSRRELRACLEHHAKQQNQLSQGMWAQVERLISPSNSRTPDQAVVAV